jgi:hypothetical protein
VRLRPGEVLECSARAFRGDEAQIGLKSSAEPHARLGVAVREHALDQPIGGECLHDGCGGAGGEDVQVTAGFASAPQASDHGDHGAGRALAQGAHERGGGVVGLRDQAASRDPRPLLDGAQNQRFLLRAHTLERAQPAVAGGAFEIFKRPDIEVAIEECHGLRPDALEVQQVENRRGKFFEQLLMVLDRSRVHELGDLAGQILADSRQLKAVGRGERRDAIRVVRNRLRGIAIRANLEGVLVLDLEQVADFGEHARDGQVLHEQSELSPEKS